MVEIKPIDIKSKKQLKEFILFEWEIYKGNTSWVPPLILDRLTQFNPQKNPFFHHSEIQPFIAYMNNKPAGRIVAILNNNHNKAHNEKTGFFGFFECVNNYEAAKSLFDKAVEWLKEKGMKTLRGPANFSSNDTWGLLIDAFDLPPMILMTYNPPYYKNLMEQYGFKKVKDVYAYKLTAEAQIPDRVKRVIKYVETRKEIAIRNINIKNFKEEIEKVKMIYNGAWEKNWGFIPMTDDEFEHLAKDLKAVIDPRLTLIAEVNGEPAGFSLCVPDINEALIKINGKLFPFGLLKLLYHAKKIKTVRFIILGVLDKFRKKGIEGVFYARTMEAGRSMGIEWGELSWILENNILMRRGIEFMGGEIYKTYRLYDYQL